MKTKTLLLHMCCGPCAEYPLEALREEGFTVSGYFFNPNIQPQKELDRRLAGVRKLSELRDFPVFAVERCDEQVWRDFSSPNKADHCNYCYRVRMFEAARFAKENDFPAFTSTLFVSPWQDHEALKQAAEEAAEHYGIRFKYRDFRPGYRQGQEMAKADELYRQRYCGCIYSLGESNYKEKILKQLDLSADAIPTRLG